MVPVTSLASPSAGALLASWLYPRQCRTSAPLIPQGEALFPQISDPFSVSLRPASGLTANWQGIVGLCGLSAPLECKPQEARVPCASLSAWHK